jgi:hypothetical protein
MIVIPAEAEIKFLKKLSSFFLDPYAFFFFQKKHLKPPRIERIFGLLIC